MKKILLILSFATSQYFCNAQTGYKTISVSGGFSSTNTKYLCLTLENDNNKKIHTGLMFQTLFYSSFNPKKLDLTSNETYQGLGFFLSSNLKNARNYSTQLYIGGAAATNFSKLIYYPFLGFSQSLFIYPNLQFFVSERVSYLINIPNGKNWQPTILGGFKILL